MKIKIVSLLVGGLFAAAMLCLPLAAHAQAVIDPAPLSTAVDPVSVPAVAGQTVPSVAGITAENIVTWLTPILVPLLIAGVKKVAPSIPGAILPIIAPVLGVLITLVANYATGHTDSLVIGAIAGLLGVALRELKETFLKAPNGGWPAPF